MNQSINCLTVTIVSPVSILWRLTPGSWMTRISRCDSKKSLTRFRFSTFPHLSYAVSQALLVTSHPLPRGPAALSACDLIQNHYCTPHLTEVYTQSPPRAPETPPPPPPLALKKPYNCTALTCAFLSFAESRCFGAEWKHILNNWHKTLLKYLKAALFLNFHRFCSCLSWNLWAKTANSPSAKCEEGSGTGLWHGRG